MNRSHLMPRSLAARTGLMVLLLLIAMIAVIAVRTVSAGRMPVLPAAISRDRDPDIDMRRAAEHLGAAIRLQTVSFDAGTDSSGAALEALRAWLADTYPRFHEKARRTIAGGGTLVYEWKGSDASLKPIILMAHQDVVPADDPSRWSHPPFSGAIEQDAVWGRGSIDDKSSLVAIMEAAEALAIDGYSPVRTILLVLGHDEESSGSGARAAADLLLSRGIKAEFALDEGSLVIADHPVSRGPVALIGISEKGYASVRVTANGAGGHASSPPPGNAVAELSHAIDAILSRPFPTRYEGATRAMLEALAPHSPVLARMAIANSWLFRPLLLGQMKASPAGAAMLRTTIVPTMLAASAKENVLPVSASAIFNIRIAPGETVASVMEHLQGAVKGLPVRLDLVGENHDPTGTSSIDSRGYRLLSAICQETFDVPVAPAPVIAATDSRSMIKVAENVYRFQPVLLTLAATEMIHGVDEHIGVEPLGRMIRFYARVMRAGK